MAYCIRNVSGELALPVEKLGRGGGGGGVRVVGPGGPLVNIIKGWPLLQAAGRHWQTQLLLLLQVGMMGQWMHTTTMSHNKLLL